MDAAALRDRAEARFDDADNSVYTEAEWLDYINDAYFDVIAADPYWPFLETRNTSLTVTTSGEVDLPTDAWRVYSVYNATDKIALSPIPGRSEFRDYFPDPDSSAGMPLYYRLRANTLEVYPRPASTISLHVDTPVPPAALGTSDEPVFPEQYHRLLVLGALSKAYEDDGNAAMAGSYQARYERLLQDMKNDLLGPRDEGFPQIIDVGA